MRKKKIGSCNHYHHCNLCFILSSSDWNPIRKDDILLCFLTYVNGDFSFSFYFFLYSRKKSRKAKQQVIIHWHFPTPPKPTNYWGSDAHGLGLIIIGPMCFIYPDNAISNTGLDSRKGGEKDGEKKSRGLGITKNLEKKKRDGKNPLPTVPPSTPGFLLPRWHAHAMLRYFHPQKKKNYLCI